MSASLPHPSFRIPAAAGEYPVYVAEGATAFLGEIIAQHCRPGRRFAVVSSTVLELHRERLDEALEGFETLAIEDGEERKTLTTVHQIASVLLERRVRRDSIMVAIGGGMVGDTAGFAASILLRGIDLVQVPTTLLSQVDSSIGGKVGVNHPLGKNLLGSFWPPRAVVSDPRFLETLPEVEVRSGLFEAMKAGVIGDPDLFAATAAGPGAFGERRDEIVRRAVAVKARIVGSDEREAGPRRLLNYGHTVGHGIEAAMQYEGITHGDAVGFGMLAANAIAAARGLLPETERICVDDAIRGMLPSAPAGLAPDRVLEAVGLDKKFTDRRRVMVLPVRVGECVVVEDVGDEELVMGIEAALQS